MPACRSPSAANRAGIVRRVNSSGRRSNSSSQVNGAETRSVGPRAHRVGPGDRAVPGVRVVVQEDAVALVRPPLARRQVGQTPLDLAGNGERRAPHLVEGPARADSDVHVNAAGARGLRPAHETDLFQDLSQHAGDGLELRPLHAGRGIEVQSELVGMLEVLGSHRERVELQARLAGHPGEGRGVAGDDLLLGPPRGKSNEGDLDPGRTRDGRPSLPVRLAVDSVGVADEHVRPPSRAAQGPRRDREVVVDDVEPGEAGLGKEDLRGIGHPDLVPPHVEHGRLYRSRHGHRGRRGRIHAAAGVRALEGEEGDFASDPWRRA